METSSILSTLVSKIAENMPNFILSVFEHITLSIPLAIISAVALFWILLLFLKKNGRLQYYSMPLFTEAEKNFLKVLDRNMGGQYRVFGKVRIADVVMPKKSLSKKAWQKHFWQVSSKHFDYVLLDKDTLDIVCVIELNDKSHNRRDRSNRDGLVQRVCDSAGVPLVWVQARKRYDTAQIIFSIENAIESAKTLKA